jgi:glycerol-3-phosphate acyltransferase PlsY
MALLAAYLLGCVQTGYYLVRFSTGQDLRKTGSGSTGARNAGRVLGRKGFLIVLIGDTVKGALAVFTSQWLGTSPLTAAAALVAVSVGHVWPIQLKFSGGRGVATGLGSLAMFDLRLLGILLAVTAVAYAAGRRFQVAGIAGFAVLPFAAWFLRMPRAEAAAVACMSIIVLFAHRSHITCWVKSASGAGSEPAVKHGDQ